MKILAAALAIYLIHLFAKWLDKRTAEKFIARMRGKHS